MKKKTNIPISEKKLNSFTKYCYSHPQERFWQALRNWAKVAYIVKATDIEDNTKLWCGNDTFFEK